MTAVGTPYAREELSPVWHQSKISALKFADTKTTKARNSKITSVLSASFIVDSEGHTKIESLRLDVMKQTMKTTYETSAAIENTEEHVCSVPGNPLGNVTFGGRL